MNTNIFIDKSEGDSKQLTYLEDGDKLFEIDQQYYKIACQRMTEPQYVSLFNDF